MSATADDRLPLASLLGLAITWNTAIAGGGIIGGVLLEQLGVGAFTPALLVLLAAALIVVWAARQHGFPAPVDTVLRSGPTTAAP